MLYLGCTFVAYRQKILLRSFPYGVGYCRVPERRIRNAFKTRQGIYVFMHVAKWTCGESGIRPDNRGLSFGKSLRHFGSPASLA
jgi:hypothetical protein